MLTAIASARGVGGTVWSAATRVSTTTFRGRSAAPGTASSPAELAAARAAATSREGFSLRRFACCDSSWSANACLFRVASASTCLRASSAAFSIRADCCAKNPEIWEANEDPCGDLKEGSGQPGRTGGRLPLPRLTLRGAAKTA